MQNFPRMIIAKVFEASKLCLYIYYIFLLYIFFVGFALTCLSRFYFIRQKVHFGLDFFFIKTKNKNIKRYFFQNATKKILKEISTIRLWH